MLTELKIVNFIIIEDQSISFGEGLNVISGETGSGKSIVLQALELILGGRSKPRYVRKGSEGWEIQALFCLDHLPEAIFNELPDIARHEELSVVRSMNSSGRGKVYINGRLASVSLLEEISSKIINICSQGQQSRLLEPKYHLELIDDYGALADEREAYQSSYLKWRDKRTLLSELERKQELSLLRRRELEDIVSDLSELELKEGRRAYLEAEVKRLNSAERLIESSQTLLTTCNSEAGLFSALAATGQQLRELERLDPEGTQELKTIFKGAQGELDEFERELQSYLHSLDIDEEALEQLREELAELARLERKYRTDEHGLIQLLAEAEQELEAVADEERLDRLREELESEEEKLNTRAAALSEKRRKAAKRLTREVISELKELNMPESKLEASFEKTALNTQGFDSVELQIATNKGHALLPLREIASGGELSRIMLVLKKVLRERSGVNVLIFDEVDSGISGSVARAVGQKLKALATDTQVLCITHLPQVASMADHHFLIEKQHGDRTKSLIRSLNEEARIKEIARMLAGYKVTEASLASARELLSSNT